MEWNAETQWSLDNPSELVVRPGGRWGHRTWPALGPRFGQFYTAGAADECWEWTGKRQASGHGKFSVQMTWVPASRVMFYLVEGWWPPVVRHTCDNPPCVNPAHLLAGTQADNLRDMVERGRHWQHQKTECPAGHPYTEESLRINRKTGHRQCRICLNERARAKRQATRVKGTLPP